MDRIYHGYGLYFSLVLSETTTFEKHEVQTDIYILFTFLTAYTLRILIYSKSSSLHQTQRIFEVNIAVKA